MKNKKQTSARVAKLAAKWAGMTDGKIYKKAFGLSAAPLEYVTEERERRNWRNFCRNLRSICASALVQTKPKAAKKVTKKKAAKK